MRKPILIGLTGAARSGKDTSATILAKLLEADTYAFAHPIKEACKTMFGWSELHVNGELKEVIDKNYGISPRQAMQKLGTEFGREMVHDEMWLKRAQVHLDCKPRLIVTDVRFDNEAQFIRTNGGHVVKIVRPECQKVNEHKSEKGVSEHLVDFTVHNNAGLGVLEDRLTALVKLLPHTTR